MISGSASAAGSDTPFVTFTPPLSSTVDAPDCQEGTESNGYRGTGPGEQVGSVNVGDRPTTGWCRDSFTMLEYRPADRPHTCIPPNAFSNWTAPDCQEGTESNGYRGTGPGERVGSQ